jgi:hypothetical protein
MAEIKFDDLYGQLKPMEQLFYDQQFEKKYDPNKPKSEQPIGLTGQSNYEAMKAAYDAKQEIPQKGILAGMIDAVSPFSEASASEVTPTNYNSNYDIASNMYTPQQQELLFGNPNYFNNQKFYKGTSVPVATPFSDSVNEPMNIEDFLGTSVPQNVTIGQAPSVFDINQVNDPALNPNSVNVFGLDPYGVNEDLRDLGNLNNDPRVASEEMGLVGGIPDRNRGIPGAPTGAYEMIGGTPVAIGDVLGKQMALEKADFSEETPQGINYDALGILGTIGGLLTGSTALKALGMFGNYKSGKTGRVFDSFSKGIGSLGSRIAGRMRGINPITGKPNTQAQYEADREARRTQNRIDYMLDRKAKKKSYSEKNLKDLIGQQIADREDKSGKGKKSGFTNPGTNSYGPHKGSGNDATREGGNCCFIMLESRYGDGTMDKVVRRYRDEKMTPRNRRGYYKMARVLVPLMRKSKLFKWIVAKTFADPLVSYGKWYYGENKHGWIFAPVKTAWLKIFDVVGTDTVFIRENGEEV